MRKLLSLCDAFAGEYDMKFNAQKSKLLVCLPRSRQKQTADSITSCHFSLVVKLLSVSILFYILVMLSLLVKMIRMI